MTYTKRRRYNRKKSIKRRNKKKRTKMKGGTNNELLTNPLFLKQEFKKQIMNNINSVNSDKVQSVLNTPLTLTLEHLLKICDKNSQLILNLTPDYIENIKLEPITPEQIAQIEKILDDLKPKKASSPNELNTKDVSNLKINLNSNHTLKSLNKAIPFANIVTTKVMAGKLIKRIREKILSLINKKCNIKILQIIFNNYKIGINLDEDTLIDETGKPITLGDKIFSTFKQKTDSQIIESIIIGLNLIRNNPLNGGGKITKKSKKKLKGGDPVLVVVVASICAVIGLCIGVYSVYSYIYRIKLEVDNVENLQKLTKIKDFIVVKNTNYIEAHLASIKIFIPYWYQRNKNEFNHTIFLLHPNNNPGSFVIYKQDLKTYLKYVTIKREQILEINDDEDEITFKGKTFKTYPELINYYKKYAIDDFGTKLIEKNTNLHSLNFEEVQIEQGKFYIGNDIYAPRFKHTDEDITKTFEEINENNRPYNIGDKIVLDVGKRIEGEFLRNKIYAIKDIILKNFKLI